MDSQAKPRPDAGRLARIAASVVGAAVITIAACGPHAPPERPSNDGAVAGGAALYAKYCALCHGANGEGYVADNANALANQDFLSTASDAFLLTAIERGRPNTPMAAYGEGSGGPLSYREVASIITHLRQWQTVPSIDLPNTAIVGDVARGAPLFADKCASCHGEKGAGGRSALSLSNPMFLGTTSDSYLRHAIAKGRSGTPMPAFEGQLSDTQLDDLTALLRSWARNVDAQPVGEVPPSFEQLVINPTGAPPTFSDLREGRYVPADEVKDALAAGARMVILDARPTSDWLRAHIPGALPVPYYDQKMIDALPNDGTWILAYCGCPHAASGKVMDALRERGFKNTAVIDEGIFVWMQRGYPMTHGRDGSEHAAPSDKRETP